MGDVGDFYKDTKDVRKKMSDDKKESNLQNAFNFLNERSIPFESKNGGIHLVVDGRVDYWPTTGKFIFRDKSKKGRGIFNLLKAIQ